MFSSDICQKRAKFIQRNNEITQEFHFANPKTKFNINNIYNMSFSGSPLWDLFSQDVESLEKSYSRSIRIMWDIPYQTHRYFLEPLSNQPHVKFMLLKGFLNFREQVFKSSKSVLKSLFAICESDCRSITGKNLRKIMLLSEKDSINCLQKSDLILLKYFPVPVNAAWRMDVLEELIDARNNFCEIPGFTSEEINELIQFICIS